MCMLYEHLLSFYLHTYVRFVLYGVHMRTGHFNYIKVYVPYILHDLQFRIYVQYYRCVAAPYPTQKCIHIYSMCHFYM